MSLLEDIEIKNIGRRVSLRFHPTVNEGELPRGSQGIIKRLLAIAPLSFEVFFPSLENTFCCPADCLEIIPA